MQKPQRLQSGDTVAIVSLSAGTLGEPFAQHQKERGVKRLEALGLNVKFMPNALRGIDYLKEHPEARAADLKAAFLDPEINGIIAAIGGDDTFRIVPYLLDDFDFVNAVHLHPKLFTGFSDTTVDHLMFYRLGLETFYGPSFLNDFAELDQTMLPYTEAAIRRLFTDAPTTPITSSPTWYEERSDFSPAALDTSRVSHHESHGYEVLRGTGVVKGALLGGNIDTFGSLMTPDRYPAEPEVATKYHLIPDAKDWQGKVLFLETSEAKPDPEAYRALLRHFKDAGILAAVAAIITGKPQDGAYYAQYKEVLLEETAEYNTPLLTNVNFGHAYPRTILPYGAQMAIDLDHKTLTIEEPYFSQNS